MHRLTLIPATAVAAVLAASLSGCGSHQHVQSAGGAGQSFRGQVRLAFRYSACMRSHGIPDFPDPKVIDSNGQQGIELHAVGAKGPTLKAANDACREYAPPAGPDHGGSGGRSQAQVEGIFALAQCLRRSGFPTFPDPDAQGDISDQQFQAAHIDLRQPAFLSAATRCLPATHGQITAAMLRAAIAHSSGQGAGG